MDSLYVGSEALVGVGPVVYFARAVDGLDLNGLLAAARTVAAELQESGLQMTDPVKVWMRRVQGDPATDDPVGLVQSDLGLRYHATLVVNSRREAVEALATLLLD